MAMGWCAHTIAFSPGHPMDYQLTFLIPALYGLGFSTCGSTGDGDSDTQCQDPQQTVSLVREPRGGPRAGKP